MTWRQVLCCGALLVLLTAEQTAYMCSVHMKISNHLTMFNISLDSTEQEEEVSPCVEA